MESKQAESASFDAIIKAFIQQFNIPTADDVNRLTEKIELLEKQLISGRVSKIAPSPSPEVLTGADGVDKPVKLRNIDSATKKVLKIIKTCERGASLKDIQQETGLGDKKIRNILYRLNKLGKIKRSKRGVYM
jgi:hypothetical protein